MLVQEMSMSNIACAALCLLAAADMTGAASAPDDSCELNQAALGAISEMQATADPDIIRSLHNVACLLEADPSTDWTKVNLNPLRAHLADMRQVIRHASARVETIATGIRVTVTGSSATAAAINRFVQAEASQLTKVSAWTTRIEPHPDGIVVVVTSPDPDEAAMIQALGFVGILASGPQHQTYHVAIARGELAY